MSIWRGFIGSSGDAEPFIRLFSMLTISSQTRAHCFRDKWTIKQTWSYRIFTQEVQHVDDLLTPSSLPSYPYPPPTPTSSAKIMKRKSGNLIDVPSGGSVVESFVHVVQHVDDLLGWTGSSDVGEGDHITEHDGGRLERLWNQTCPRWRSIKKKKKLNYPRTAGREKPLCRQLTWI